MRWAEDSTGAEWTATVTRDALIRVVRRSLKKPYREGEDPREEYETFVFSADEASALADELNAAVDIANEGIPE